MKANPCPNYVDLMRQALWRVEAADLQIKQAASMEELDLARAALQVSKAELQQLIRSAKREQGIELRPIEELETFHRNLRDRMYGRTSLPDVSSAPPAQHSTN